VIKQEETMAEMKGTMEEDKAKELAEQLAKTHQKQEKEEKEAEKAVSDNIEARSAT
jgi:aminoglycoside phosphotransferase family enzyme